MGGDPFPKTAQAFQSILRRITGNDGGIDCADRNSRHPVGQVFRRRQGLVNPGLIAAKRAFCTASQVIRTGATANCLAGRAATAMPGYSSIRTQARLLEAPYSGRTT